MLAGHSENRCLLEFKETVLESQKNDESSKFCDAAGQELESKTLYLVPGVPGQHTGRGETVQTKQNDDVRHARPQHADSSNQSFLSKPQALCNNFSKATKTHSE